LEKTKSVEVRSVDAREKKQGNRHEENRGSEKKRLQHRRLPPASEERSTFISAPPTRTRIEEVAELEPIFENRPKGPSLFVTTQRGKLSVLFLFGGGMGGGGSQLA